MKRFAYFLGYLWMSPMVILGALLYLYARARDWVDYRQPVGPGILVILRGPFADKRATPNASGRFWRANTIGPFMFCYTVPESSTVSHELVHVRQQMLLGIFQPILYGLFWLYARIETGDSFQAYWQNPFEKQARKAEGE